MQRMPRPLSELLNTDDPAWPLVQQWIAQAKNPVEVLPPAANAADELHLAPGWREEIATMGGHQVMSPYPPLSSVGGKNPATLSRMAVPGAEAYAPHVEELPRQFGA